MLKTIARFYISQIFALVGISATMPAYKAVALRIAAEEDLNFINLVPYSVYGFQLDSRFPREGKIRSGALHIKC